MAIRQPIYYVDSDRFTFTDGTYVAEASDFDGKLVISSIYDDACDAGFAMRSKRTGNIVWFYEALVQRDRDYDIQWWDYAPIPEHVRKYPALAGMKVRIYND